MSRLGGNILSSISAQGSTPDSLAPNFEQLRGIGGADRDRTGDPLLAKQVLSQLSYSPIQFPFQFRFSVTETETETSKPIMVGLGRVELPTSPLSGVRSSQLSYRPGAGSLELLAKIFEDRLNVHSGYAGTDHR